MQATAPAAPSTSWTIASCLPKQCDARCTCPDFEDSGQRCKHVVATVFTVLDQDDAELEVAAGRLSRLTDMLDMEGRDDALMLVDRARRDPAFLRELEGDPVG